MVSKASEDLPEPESPVNTTRWSRGISRSTFLRLCSRAPRIEITRAPSKEARGDAGERRGRLLSKRSFMQVRRAVKRLLGGRRRRPDAAPRAGHPERSKNGRLPLVRNAAVPPFSRCCGQRTGRVKVLRQQCPQ